MYTSPLSKDIPIIDDSYPTHLLQPRSLGRGYNPRDWSEDPFGELATPFPLPLIPRSEWAPRIREREETKSRLKDLKKWAGFKSLNQSNTNYCWANGVVATIHYHRAQLGYKHVPLSPASVAAPIKNYRNVGGWGSQALEYIMKHGVAPQSLWPANGIDRKYDTLDSRASRKSYVVTEFWELHPRNLDELISALLYGIPVAVGYNWWGHEVMAHDPVILATEDFGIEIDNSWGDWGDQGHGVLTGSKMLPDEAVGPRAITPTPE